jgi:outer membrane protein assembly factor BamB
VAEAESSRRAHARTRPRARVVPLAVLLSLVAMALVVRSRSGLPKLAPLAAPSAASMPESARTTPTGSVTTSGGLGAPLPTLPARVVDKAARTIHGDAHHTHRAHGRVPRKTKLAWSFATGGPIEAQVTASPDEQTLYVASLDGSLTALARNGEKKWSLPLGDRVYATPCIGDDGTIYVGSDAKLFFAVSPEGRIKWKLDTAADADTGAALTKEGNVVFAAGNTLFMVRPAGDVAWRFRAKRKIFTAPAITDDGKVVVGSQDHRVYAIGSRGALAWSVDLGADVDGAASIGDDGAMFVGTDAGEVVRLGDDGGVLWRSKVGGFVRGTLSVTRSGDVLAGTYGPTPRAVRIAATDGAVRGAMAIQGTGARDFGVHGGALEDDQGMLVFGAQDDAIYAVDTASNVVWRYVTGGDVDAPVTLLSDGTIVAASDDGKVYCLSPSE